jgi:hypothetical protein
MLHYDPTNLRSMNAAMVATRMREAVPDATDAEVRAAARALAAAQWDGHKTAGDFWADSVLVNWRLADTDRPF